MSKTLSLYSMFDTDTTLETEGVEVEYGGTRFILARAGGANTKFKTVFTELIKPYRAQMNRGVLDDDVSNRIMAKAYAKTVVLRVDCRKMDADGNLATKNNEPVWTLGKFYTREGKLVEATEENVAALLLDVDELFADIRTMAANSATYLKEMDEEDEGNSESS